MLARIERLNQQAKLNEAEKAWLKDENASLQAVNSQLQERVNDLEGRASREEAAQDSLQRRVADTQKGLPTAAKTLLQTRRDCYDARQRNPELQRRLEAVATRRPGCRARGGTSYLPSGATPPGGFCERAGRQPDDAAG